MRLKFGESWVNFPDFLVVGAAKSGTSSLHNYLASHPDIVLPISKETWFWHQNRNPNRAIYNYWDESRIPQSLEEYLELFAKAQPDQMVGEVCPSYLYYHELTIDSLKSLHPKWRDTKILIILRNPTDRILSEYRFVRQNQLDPEALPLELALQAEDRRKYDDQLLLDLHYRGLSQYCSQVKAYQNAFPNIFVCLYDDLRADAGSLLKEIFIFLGVDPDIQLDLTKRYNVSRPVASERTLASSYLFDCARRAGKALPLGLRSRASSILYRLLFKPEVVSRDVEQSLRNEFIPEIEELEKLIGRDLSRWKDF